MPSFIMKFLLPIKSLFFSCVCVRIESMLDALSIPILLGRMTNEIKTLFFYYLYFVSFSLNKMVSHSVAFKQILPTACFFSTFQ